jgi:hypothetical protein
MLIYIAAYLGKAAFRPLYHMADYKYGKDGGERRQAVTSGELPHRTHLQAATIAGLRSCSRTIKDFNNSAYKGIASDCRNGDLLPTTSDVGRYRIMETKWRPAESEVVIVRDVWLIGA